MAEAAATVLPVGAAARIERVVTGVVLAALRDSGATSVVLLDDQSPEGALVGAWLDRALPAGGVQRASVLASNVQEVRCDSVEEAHWLAAWRAARNGGALIAHPLNRTALLLGGPPPRADLLPLGDLGAGQVESLTGSWSAPPDVAELARRAGGAAVLDAAIEAWMRRESEAARPRGLENDVAERMIQLYERGRFFRVRPRLVPKLGAGTLDIDLWD